MKHLLILVIATFLFSSCNQNPSTVNRIEYDSLVNVLSEKEESITNFVTAFNDVESNLDSIAVKQKIIFINSNNGGEFTQSQKARINNEIKSINALMTANISKIEDITKKFKASSAKNTVLQKTIKTITNQLNQKQSELVVLNNTLSKLNIQVEKLETSVEILMNENSIQADIIDYSISEIQTAYYVIGKSSKLLEDKIIDKKGGLLGVGKTTEINKDIDNSNFREINYSEKTVFAINSKGVKIITSHPTKSYILETDINDANKVTNLVIVSPILFWSVSKYLVVATK